MCVVATRFLYVLTAGDKKTARIDRSLAYDSLWLDLQHLVSENNPIASRAVMTRRNGCEHFERR